jgi:hypothetical protein
MSWAGRSAPPLRISTLRGRVFERVVVVFAQAM